MKVFEAEIVVNFQKCLVVAEAAEPWLRGFLAAEETDAAASDFLIDGGVSVFVVVLEGESVLVEGKWDQVVRG